MSSSLSIGLVVLFAFATSYGVSLRCYNCDSVKTSCTNETIGISDCLQLDPTFDSCITMTAKLINQTSAGKTYTEVTIRNCTKKELCGENAVGCYPLKNQPLAGCRQSCCVTDECNRPETKENPTTAKTVKPDISTVPSRETEGSPDVTTQPTEPVTPKVEAGRNGSTKRRCYSISSGFVFFALLLICVEKLLLPD